MLSACLSFLADLENLNRKSERSKKWVDLKKDVSQMLEIKIKAQLS